MPIIMGVHLPKDIVYELFEIFGAFASKFNSQYFQILDDRATKIWIFTVRVDNHL